MQPEYNEVIGCKLASAQMQYDTSKDPTLFFKSMKQLARSCKTLPASPKPNTVLRRAIGIGAGAQGKGGGKGKGAALKMKQSSQLCFRAREGLPCRVNPCPFAHEGFTGLQCTDPQFVTCGICSHFSDCKHKHKVTAELKAAAVEHLDPHNKMQSMYVKSLAMMVTDEMSMDELSLGRVHVPKVDQLMVEAADLIIETSAADGEGLGDLSFDNSVTRSSDGPEATDSDDTSLEFDQSDDSFEPSGPEISEEFESIDEYSSAEDLSEVEMTDVDSPEGSPVRPEPNPLFGMSQSPAECQDLAQYNDPVYTQIQSQLTASGWQQEDIHSWCLLESTKATEAAPRNIPYAQSDLAMGATHGECIPWVWLLCDNGTFDHLIGTLAMIYMVNIREIEPYPVKTGGCVIWLIQKGDLCSKNMF